MATATLDRPDSRFSRETRQVGYGITIVIDIALIFVINNLVEWEWFPFLTEDFDHLVPLISFSLGMTAAVNLAYLWFDPRWFKVICEAVLGFITVLVMIRTFQVFPFDFASDFWTTTVRVLIVIVGAAVALSVLGQTLQYLTGQRPSS